MSTGQALGGVVGGAIGAVIGGPSGAIYGAQIGIMAGGLLDPPKGPTIEGPRLGDLSVQTSTYGQFIPRTYGTIGLSGNVFWLENNQLKEVVKKKKSGGKGGGSSSTIKTYTYYATFAVGLCEGPIAGVRRIWVGPDLVYDAGTSDLETIIASNQAAQGFSVYLGTDTQQPDPRMQAEMGVANCPAYRGLTYIVVKDLLLTDYGNSVAGAQVKVEVVNSAIVSDFRKLLEVASPIKYKTPGFPASEWPYIPEALGSATVTTANTSTIFNTDGSTSPGPPSKKLSNPSGQYYYCGWLDTGVELSVRVTFNPFDPSYVNVALDIPASDISGMVIHSLTVDGDGSMILALFSPASLGSSINGGKFYLMNSDGSVIKSGLISANITSYDVSFGRTAQQNYSASCISSDGSKVYFANSTGKEVGILEIGTTLGNLSRASNILASIPSSCFPSIIESSGILYIVAGDRFFQFALTYSIAPQSVQLSSIFNKEAERSSLVKLADIDSSGLTDSVTGFKVTATGSIRNAIEPLRGAWPFDVVQAGYKIKARTRGTASVVTIPVGELAIDTQLTESREMDSQLPQNITVKYIDRERDYDGNEQRAQRDNTEAVNSLLMELPVVLSAAQAAQVADKLIRIYALEKSDFSFILPAPYRYLEPGDVVTISAPSADFVLRLASVNYTADGRLECSGRPSSASTYTSIAPGDGGQGGGTTIPLAGATVGLLIDCPVIDEGLQDAPGFAAGATGYSAGWPGGILYRTADGGQTWDDLQAFNGKATAGYAAGFLAASAGNLIQRGGSLTVSLISGALESVTEAQMLNGANVAAYGVNGRWEIIRFQNATLNVDGTYTLDTFWRGDKGTEWTTGLHAANDYFVLMTDPDIAFVGMPTDSIGQPRDYRAITSGASIDSAASSAFTYVGVNLETLSGVHPVGVRNAADLTISWQRRTRVGGAWRDNVDASLGESVQAYEVDIMQGATVKRTLTASTPSVLYTSAMQVTDFGSPQTSVTVNIYQLSSVVGRGYPLGATL